ncbi:MAG: 4'-phosphopantetheinyl transferase superfamily protein [Bergeyella zoohelcum]|nr:4'-phosphopantetheinyl transferase superfamily protein [Bergeyella zoohelcum]
MPLFFKHIINDNSCVYCWKYDEQEHLPIDELATPQDLIKIKGYHIKKVKEFLMIRKILRTFLPNQNIEYRDNGEPYLSHSDSFISISHSFPFGVLSVSNQPIGIDFEIIKDKILSVKHKFINENEQNWLGKNFENTEYLTAIWTIKEALYKIHHAKLWSLKKHYEIEAFDLENPIKIKCKVFKENEFEDIFYAQLIRTENAFLAIVSE